MGVVSVMPAGTIILDDITSADWSLTLDANSPSGSSGSGIGNVVQGIADINQCIGIILATPPGSDPLRDVLRGLVASAKEPIAGGRHKVFGHPDLHIIPTTSTVASHLPR